MPVHKVIAKFPSVNVTKADFHYEIKADGKLLGRLEVSKGGIVWYDKRSKKGHKAGWKSLRNFMNSKPIRETKSNS